MSHHLVGAAEVAEMLGVTRQRVSQLVESYPDFPKPEAELSAGRVWSRTAVETWMAAHPVRKAGRAEGGQGMFQRFTDRARTVIVLTQEEARGLKHSYIGTEHLLLGLLHEGEGVAAKALGAFDVSLEQAREEVQGLAGAGSATPTGHIPFTPRAKKVLELALREALQLGHNYIGTEHILLALLREGEGVGSKVLDRLGVEIFELRKAVLAIMQGFERRGTPAMRQRGRKAHAVARGRLKRLSVYLERGQVPPKDLVEQVKASLADLADEEPANVAEPGGEPAASEEVEGQPAAADETEPPNATQQPTVTHPGDDETARLWASEPGKQLISLFETLSDRIARLDARLDALEHRLDEAS